MDSVHSVTPECMFWRFWGWFWDVWGVFGSSFVWLCSVRARFWCEASGKWWASFTTWIGSIGTRRTHGWLPFPRVAWLFRRCWTMFSTCSAVSTCWTLVSAKTFNVFQHLSTVSWCKLACTIPTTSYNLHKLAAVFEARSSNSYAPLPSFAMRSTWVLLQISQWKVASRSNKARLCWLLSIRNLAHPKVIRCDKMW